METANSPDYANPPGEVDKGQRISVTRGAIGGHVKLLEERLVVSLFRWLPRGIELIEPGRRFPSRASAVGE